MRFFKTIWSGWWNQAGVAFSVATFIAAAFSWSTGKDIRIPPWILLMIGTVSLVAVLINSWRKADQFQGAFKTSLDQRCRALIDGWSELARLNGGDILDPLSPAWKSYTSQKPNEVQALVFTVGELQGLTYSLMADLRIVFPQCPLMDYRTALPKLLNTLNEYRETIRVIV